MAQLSIATVIVVQYNPPPLFLHDWVVATTNSLPALDLARLDDEA
jgi:hypothetical protein